jgi:hypothetical protein
VAADGYTYERASIEEHLRSSATSPVNGEALSTAVVYPNLLVKSLIKRLADASP